MTIKATMTGLRLRAEVVASLSMPGHSLCSRIFHRGMYVFLYSICLSASSFIPEPIVPLPLDSHSTIDAVTSLKVTIAFAVRYSRSETKQETHQQLYHDQECCSSFLSTFATSALVEVYRKHKPADLFLCEARLWMRLVIGGQPFANLFLFSLGDITNYANCTYRWKIWSCRIAWCDHDSRKKGNLLESC